MKILLIFVTFICTVFLTQAQVKLNLSLMADNKTYLMSMVPDGTWTYPMNITGTSQITLRYPAGAKFLVSNFKNLIPNVLWHDNSYLEAPQSAKNYSFVSFGLRSQGTAAINYLAGQEVPLFSFQNYYDCVGKIELLNNTDINLSGEDALTYNIGNHWTTVAQQKEAYVGNLQSVVNCSIATSTQEQKIFSTLSAYPVPAYDRLTLKINVLMTAVQKINEIKIFNVLGKVISSQKIKLQLGEQELTLDVSDYSSGLYLFQLKGEDIVSDNYKFIVTKN